MKTKSNNSNHKFGWKYFDLHVPDNDETVLVVYRPEKDYHKEIEYGFGKYKDGKWIFYGCDENIDNILEWSYIEEPAKAVMD
jgi:hypothetical protein